MSDVQERNAHADELEAAASRTGPKLSIHLTGELDACCRGRLTEVVARHLTPGDRSVCVDLAGVRFLDAAGISELIRCHRMVAGEERSFEIAHPNRLARLTLQVAEVEPLLRAVAG